MKFLHKTITLLALFALLLTATPPQPAYAASIVVNSNADIIAVDGVCTLREAIINANNDSNTHADCEAGVGTDTITFAGDYAITLGSSTLPTITSDLTIDSSGQNITISGGGFFQVMNIASGTVFLNALTITGGFASDGGGISNNSTLTVTDSTFFENSAITHGGGIENRASGTLTVTNSTFSYNSADTNNGNGGGIANSGSLTITDSAFDHNVAYHGGAIENGDTLRVTNTDFNANVAGNHGGAINNGSSSLLEITGGTFSGNVADYGGGIANDDGTVTVIGSLFVGNIAVNGGGISGGGTLTVTDSTFSNNSAYNGGGILNAGTLTVTDSTFDGNYANNGGGIRNNGGTLTITNSAFSDNSATNNNGGGIDNQGGTLTITDSTFFQNSAKNGGGGINIINNEALNGATLVVIISNSTFSENSATHSGGGINNYNATLTVSNSTFSENDASNGSGIGNQGRFGTLAISNSTFSQNSAIYNGGGVYNGGPLTVNNSTFSDNSADAGGGGGIYNVYTLTITDSTFSGNSADAGGGGIYNDTGELTITNGTFDENTAGYGGGIRNFYGTMEVTNSTFSGNSATTGGGGIQNAGDNSTATVNNSTFSDNEASSGGGIYNGGSVDTTLQIQNVIIANSVSGGDCVNAGSATLTVASSNNLIEDTTHACDLTNGVDGNIIGSDPILGPLADNGGDTETHALLTGSPAIDAGDDSTCEATDQRGVTRPQGSACDMGAYETGASILTVTSTTPSAGATIESLTSIVVNFNEDALHDGSNKAADDEDNYLLVERGNGIFDTLSCAGVVSDDIEQTISSATYTNNGGSGPFSATLTFSPLAEGNYRLFICGTTSIWSVAGLELNNGAEDTTVDFTVQVVAPASAPAALPATGFAMGRVTTLDAQPENKAYTETAMMLEIPKLNLTMPIVGVPQSESGWDVNWLGNSAGYLAGSAFPTWAGNTVITAHVWDAWNQPGAFAELKSLNYGDQVQIKAWGLTYTYEVRESKLVTTKNVNAVLQSEDYDWVTLVTCEFYNPFTGDYLFRRAVRAVLISVK